MVECLDQVHSFAKSVFRVQNVLTYLHWQILKRRQLSSLFTKPVDAKVRDHNLHRVESRKDVLDSRTPEKKTIRRMPWLHVPASPDRIRETSWSRAMCMAMKYSAQQGSLKLTVFNSGIWWTFKNSPSFSSFAFEATFLGRQKNDQTIHITSQDSKFSSPR